MRVSLIEDDSATVQSIELMLKSESLAQAIVDTVRAPLLVLDKNLRVLAASRSFYLTFKVARAETLGRLLYALGDGQWNIPRLRLLLENIVPEHGVMDDYEVEHEFPDIGRRSMLLNAREVFYEGNSRTTLLLGIEDVTARRALEREKEDRDITELRHSEEQLRASRRELALVSRQTAMGAMTASIAHEINQPLTAIVTNANAGLRWLKRPEPDLDEVQAVLERIVSDGHRTNEVIASIRVMFGTNCSEKAPVNVNTLIREVLALAHGELESHQISLRTEMFEGLPAVVAERVQLQQVLLNLIMNAVDAMSPVSGRERRLTIKTEIQDLQGVKIAVEDSGTGIAPSHLDRIFDPFFTTKPLGMGIGLSICRSIIESHGGRLWATPRSPYGTTFHVQLPSGTANGA